MGVLIQKASRSGRASGSQCSSGTILWSLVKSCDVQAKWRYRGRECFLVTEKCARKHVLRLLEVTFITDDAINDGCVCT